ncbi:aminotransferase class V-fold PLP-dependent enzyme, partial [Oxalobacteraceae bacterium A2-2]
HQIKLRGMRIEAGEVEAQLRRLPGVKEALVAAFALEGEQQPGRLVAYIVAEGAPPSAAACRQSLKMALPDYMVPEVYLFLDALPLTRTGKTDRAALPAPSGADLENARYVAPRDATEEALCRLWQQLLRRERVGIEDNFFESGGHSLLATRLLSQIRQQLQVELPLRALFEHPTIAALSAALSGHGRGAAAPIPRATRAGPLPLSFAQQRLWFIDQLEGGSAEYNLPMQFEVRGALDVAALRCALQALVERHEALRTSIAMDGGQAVQLIQQDAELALQVHDLEQLDQTAQPQALARITAADAAAPFDLTRDVLLRAHLFHLGGARHRVFLNLPHIAADGWSLGILFRELNALYNAYAQGQPSPLAPLAVQYADYAQWQRDQLRGDALERHLGYWREQLDGLPAMHSLPLDKPRPARQRFKGKCHAQTLDGSLLAAVQTLCQRQQVTLFMFLQTAFATLLQRYSGEDDIVIGAPIAGRLHRDAEPLVGLFVNSLVLRSDLSGNPGFSTQLARNKQMILGAYEHQAVPFEMLVEQLQPERSMSHSPLFQVTLTLQNNEAQPLAFHGLELERNVTSHNGIKCDLELTVTEADGRLYLDWDYNVDLYARASVERMAANFEVLVRGIVAQPDAALADLPLLGAAERRRLLDAWNDSAAEWPRAATVHGLVQDQAAATPYAHALLDGALAVPYGELEARANRLARWLRGHGAGPGAVVGLCMERSAAMVAAMLAIMKSGAAYLPLDPAHPPARLAFLAADASAVLVLGESAHAGALPPGRAPLVCLDDMAVAAQLAAFSDAAPLAQAGPDDPACVIYTSGSTGEPKGVLVPHRAIVNRLAWMRRVFPPAAGEVYSQKTSLNFVDHVAEVFQPLIQGSPLVLVRDHEVRDLDLLLGNLRAHGVTRLTAVPSLLALLADHPDLEQLDSLRYLASSGEPLGGALAARLRARLPRATLVNLYGSTETGADATFQVVHDGLPAEVMRYFPREVELSCGLDGAATPLALGGAVVAPGVTLGSLVAGFSDTATPESSQPFERYLDYLNRQVMPHVVNVASPRFIGHMTSQLPNFMAEFARVLTILNQNMVKIETSKSLSLAERQAVAMVHRQFFDLPEQAYADHAQDPHSNFGLVTSGGTTSNITAMLCARNRGLRALGHSPAEIAAQGATALLHQAGLGPGVIIGSRLAHYSIRKAANLLGVGERNILLIDQDDEQRLSMEHLVQTIERCRAEGRFIIALIGIAGATETGTIDPLPEMAAIARRYRLHFHVDAAWGGAIRFSSRFRGKLKGIEQADTVTFCGHKQMYLPQGISLVLFREPQDTGILPMHTAYQAQRGTFDMGQHTLEGSRPANALLLHAALHLLGRQGYGWLVDQSMAQAAHFAALVEASDAFELVGRPEINIVNYRYIPAALRGKKYGRYDEAENAAISAAVESIQQEQFLRARSFVSKTRVLHRPTGDSPVTVFRVVFSNPLVGFGDLREVLCDQLEIAAGLVEQGVAAAGTAEALRAVRSHAATSEAALVPAGAPLQNMRVRLLDRHLGLAPQGAVGEICIGGPGLALGYLNRPELNAVRFIDDPFLPGERLFRTGDYARWLPDGTLQYCGRQDAQCKVRGARVELGEIEAALLRVDGVRQAVVAPAGDGRLAAYVALEEGAEAHGGDALRGLALRGELRRTLPDYMVPELYVFVDGFLTTATGKIDRARLPVAGEAQPAAVVAPRDAVECELCAIWSEVLKRGQVGVKCNFFELGGHSLLAMTAVNHIRKRLGVRLPLVTLFEYPDIEGVANVIRALPEQGAARIDGGAEEEQVDLLL